MTVLQGVWVFVCLFVGGGGGDGGGDVVVFCSC